MGNTGTVGRIRSHMLQLILFVRVLDGGLIAGAMFAATWATQEPWTPTHTVAALVAIGLFSVLGEANQIYGSWRGISMKHELLRVFTTYLLCLPGLLIVGYFSLFAGDIAVSTAALWLAFAPVAVVGTRAAIRLFLQQARMRGRNTRRVGFVGATQAAYRLRQTIDEAPWHGLRIHGFYDDRWDADTDADEGQTPRPDVGEAGHPDSQRVVHMADLGEYRGDFDQLIADAREGAVDILYFALPLRAEVRIRELLAALADTTVQVHVIADVVLTDLMESHISSVGGLPVIDVFDHPFHGLNGALKRLEDLILGSVIVALIALPMAVIAIVIKATSKGGPLFQQRRYGLNGQEIRVLKFRSMSVADDGDEVVQATRGDARITKVGAFLRRTSLDELPQFLQVLTGEMSIVGPRPHAVAHNERYRRLIPGYMLRHKVKPGITGWAQVNGWRGETDTLEKMEKRIEHDLFYLSHWTLPLDLKIIFLTVVGTASRQNAY